MTKQTEHQDVKTDLYEIGYLIVPTVAEEQLPGVVTDIKKVLEKHGAALAQEGAPVLRDLAYQMIKAVAGKNRRYDTAYFGWMTFTAPKAEAPAIKKALDAMEDIIRFIFVKTEEKVIIPPRIIDEVAADGTTEAAPEAPALSQEELDKKIDTLVTS